jgi:hypothetical protein
LSQIIEIIVSPSGDAKVETKGFAGNSCKEASRYLEQALGLVSGEQLTDEYFLADVTRRQVTEEGGRP